MVLLLGHKEYSKPPLRAAKMEYCTVNSIQASFLYYVAVTIALQIFILFPVPPALEAVVSWMEQV